MNAKEQLEALKAEIELAELSAEYEELGEQLRSGKSEHLLARFQELGQRISDERARVRAGGRRPTVVTGPAEEPEKPKKRRWF